jgi:hypothetical protein
MIALGLTIPFHTTRGGHRRFDAEAVLDALRATRPHVPARISVGPARWADIPAGTSSINFGAAAPSAPVATEVAALAGAARREPLPAPQAPNRVRASLMR